MLRACHKAVRRGGRIAGYTIHTPKGLDGDAARRASELGPSEVVADRPPADLLRAADFTVMVDEDVTDDFEEILEATRAAMDELEDDLRREEGDTVFEEWQERRTNMFQGVSGGLLRRSLLVAVKE